jgi:hypothetical protein
MTKQVITEPAKDPPRVRQRVETALKTKHRVAGMRRSADELGHIDPLGARFMRDDAAALELKADADLSRWSYTTGAIEVGNGGELRPLPEPATAALADHVAEPPETLAHSASTQRMELACEIDALTLSLDAANAIQARDSIERMLAAQAAAAHKLAMRLLAKADHHLERAHSGNAYYQAHSVEAARLAHAAGKLMGAFANTVLTVQRRRSGGKQVVQVIHQQVAVGAGGKAIVAGSVKGRGNPGGKRGAK